MSAHKARKKPTKLSIALLSSVMALLLIFTIVFNVLSFTWFDNLFTQFLGYSSPRLRGNTLGADTEYYKSNFNSPAELYAYEEQLCAQIAQDGATLLKNDGLLPLKEGTQLDLYSVSSVNLVSGGSGSGSGSFELTADLKEGLEHAGFKVNENLWNFYKNGVGSNYKRGVGVVNYGRGFEWEINECPLSEIKASNVLDGIDGANSVAMFVISRTGGEGGDEPRDMAEFGGNSGEHYLELNTEEKKIIRFLGNTYKHVIILVNSNNAFELGWIRDTETYKNIDAVLNFPGAGRTGTYGLGYILRGKDQDGKEISPSGHFVDTFVYDNFSSPAMQNFGDAAFTDAQGNVLMYWGKELMYSDGQYGSGNNKVNEDAGRCPFYFVTYNEGIYVGYKYYETRYEDYVLGVPDLGNYNYAETVTYPFGFGCSYTDFEWENYSVTDPDAAGNMQVKVTVKNVGSRAGRDVVQVYYQAPYTQYDKDNYLEKASVNLAGFAKTDIIAAGESCEVTITVNINDFKSYDEYGKGGYLLEQGDYYITAAADAHTAVNNIIRAKCTDSSILTRIIETEQITGISGITSNAAFVKKYHLNQDKLYNTASNLFSDATLIDRSQYLSRSNWSAMDNLGLRYATSQATVDCPGVGKNPWGNTHIAACAEIDGKQFRAVVPDSILQKLMSSDSLIEQSKKQDNSTTPVLNKNNGLDLIDLRGASYDDPRWDLLLEQTNTKELAKLVAQCGYCSPEMKSVNKPKVADLDGPAGLNKVVGHGSWPIGDGYYAMTWATEYMLACTWDTELALKMGECVGEDGLYGKISGWYGPGMNLHRTPFGGRNFEYYSEDALLSGMMGKMEVRGAASKGLYGFVKHFALNDQETHRDQNGLVTFSNEQAMREFYFKPFELTIKDNCVTINVNASVTDDNGKIVGYTMQQTTVPACTAVMSSFNRIGATWAGGNYKLITKVLREEFGFKGFVLTDYDTGNYMVSNTKQMLEAGGDAKLNTIGTWNGLRSGADVNENINYAKQAAKNVLYTVVNSAAMNGFVHGVQYVPGTANYKYIVLAWDVMAVAALALLTWQLVKKCRLYKQLGSNKITSVE